MKWDHYVKALGKSSQIEMGTFFLFLWLTVYLFPVQDKNQRTGTVDASSLPVPWLSVPSLGAYACLQIIFTESLERKPQQT